MEYKKESLTKYLDDLSAKLAAPGGGSAAAMAAAMAASLLEMVLNFTIGKPKYAEHEAELKGILKKCTGLRLKFLELVDLDVLAYSSKNMRDALNIPFMTARLSCEGIKFCLPLITKSNVNLISDVAVAAVFFEAAFVSARFNVDINLKILGDKELAKNIRKELSQKEKLVRRIRSTTEVRVGKVIGR